MPSERTLILRRLETAVEPAQRARKARFGRRSGLTCRVYHCDGCRHTFSEAEVPDARCPTCGAKVAA